ncbi:Ral GTPase-activating protein subunit alpha-2 [Rhizophlyctis rosea]|nr:Ral GTPase-activating protein subunit alpha-2 [Rhizophlyctis rosea]
MADEKRMEKLLKRARPFLDDKNKSKVRLAALQHFIEGATEQDEAKFFQEHDYQIYTVVYESFIHQTEKVRAHYKPDKGFQPSQKEVAVLFEILEILQKIFRHMGEKMRSGWQRRSVVGLLQTLIATSNHPRLRSEGLRLLLLYLNVHTAEPLEAVPLYANAIPLGVYESFPLPRPPQEAKRSCVGTDETGLLGKFERADSAHAVEWKGEGKGVLPQQSIEAERRVHNMDAKAGPGDSVVPSPILSEDLGLDRNPIIPSPNPPTAADCTELFEDLLHNFTYLATAASNSASIIAERRASSMPEGLPVSPGPGIVVTSPLGASLGSGGGGGGTALNRALSTTAGNSLIFMWEIFKKYYLRILFPGIARKVGMEIADGEGFATCPPQILHSLVSFFLRHCFNSSPLISQGTGLAFSPYAQNSVRTSAILQNVLLRTEQNREIVHEILRQCFSVPYEWSEVARGAVLIVAGWTCVPNEDRPMFLRRPPPTPPALASSHASLVQRSTTPPPLGSQSASSSMEWDPHDGEMQLDPHANMFLRRYMRYMTLNFLERTDGVEFMDKQILLFKEVINYFRTIALENGLLLDSQSWTVLLCSLLEICRKVMGHPNKCAVVHSAFGAEEVADLIMETVFGCWVRSGTRDEEMWSRLRQCVEGCTRWKECVGQWAKAEQKLTKLLSIHVYSLDPDAPPVAPTDSKSRSRGSPSITSTASNQGAYASSISSSTHKRKLIASNTFSSSPSSETPLLNPSPGAGSSLDKATMLEKAGTNPSITVSSASDRSGVMAASTPPTPGMVGSNSFSNEDAERADAIGGLNASERSKVFARGESRVAFNVPEGSGVDAGGKSGMAQLIRDIRGSMHSVVTLQSENSTSSIDTTPRIPLLAAIPFPRAAEFPIYSNLPWWSLETVLYVWKHMLCVIGDFNNIQVPANHAEAISCLVSIWDTLEKIRTMQPYEGVKMPPLFDFATWIFEAADMPPEYADGRAHAYGCMCRMMCRRHDQSFSPDLYSHFYRILIKGLLSDDLKVTTAIFNNSTKLFTLCLPGSHILIPSFIKAIKRQFVDNYQKANQAIPEAVRQNAITILLSLISIGNHYHTSKHNRSSMLTGGRHSVSQPTALAPSRSAGVEGHALELSDMSSETNDTDSTTPSRRPTIIGTESLTPQPLSHTHSRRRSASISGLAGHRPSISLSTRPLAALASGHATGVPDILGVPVIDYMQVEEPLMVPFSDLKVMVKDALLAMLWEERTPMRMDKNPETPAMLLWGLAAMGLEEMVRSAKPMKEVVDDCINALMDHLTVGNVKIVNAATDGLIVYARNRAKLPYLDNAILQGVLEKLVGALTEQLIFSNADTAKEAKGQIVTRLFHCLLEWVMALPQELLSNPKVSTLVFEVIENGLNVRLQTSEDSLRDDVPRLQNHGTIRRRARLSIYDIAGPLTNQSGAATGPSAAALTPSNEGLASTRPGSGTRSERPLSDRPMSMVLDGKWGGSDWVAGEEKEGGGSGGVEEEKDESVEMIKEAAENALMHILHQVGNFAPPYGPSMLSSQILDPALSEDPTAEPDRYLYFTFNGTTLITLVEIPGSSPLEARARLIVRDMTGRYAWDSYTFYQSLRKMQRLIYRPKTGNDSKEEPGEDDVEDASMMPNPQDFDDDPCRYLGIAQEMKLSEDVTIESRPRVLSPDAVTYARKENELPAWEEERGVDMGQEHPDCLFRDRESLVTPAEIPQHRIEVIAGTAAQLRRQIHREMISADDFVFGLLERFDGESGTITPEWDEHDDGSSLAHELADGEILHPTNSVEILQHTIINEESEGSNDEATELQPEPMHREHPPEHHNHLMPMRPIHHRRPSVASHSMPATKNYVHVRPMPHPRSGPPFLRSRLLLSHLGHMNFDGLKDGCFHLLGKSSALYRDIKVLDRKHGREVIKVAILYVAPGQEDEQSVLRNDRASAEYNDFVSSLGWEVDLATHPGFLGGLERNTATGSSATYYCTSTLEMIFHDVVKMPTDPNDKKQVKKKRHIGNDHVHIIWNEHYRDYRRNTIGGDFGNAQIVVTPLPNALYAIECNRDGKVSTFGPLQNRMVVSKAALGPLVRSTAINAHHAALHPPAIPSSAPAGGMAGASNAQHTHAKQRHAFAARREDIATITKRHRVAKWTFERFLQSVFGTGAEGATAGEAEGAGGSGASGNGSGSGEGQGVGAPTWSPVKLDRMASGVAV